LLAHETALRAFKPKLDLFCGFGLFPEDGLRLAAITGLLFVVTPFALSDEGGGPRFIQGAFEFLMSTAFSAEHLLCLRQPHHFVFFLNFLLRTILFIECDLKVSFV